MKELGITMDLKSKVDSCWWDHITNDNINNLQGAITLHLQKLNNSLGKEPISTHTKRATWTLDTKDKKQISSQLSKTKMQASKCKPWKKLLQLLH